MDTIKRCIIICMFCTITMNIVNAAVEKLTSETRLLNTLLEDYNPRARPVTHPNDTVQVKLSMYILKLQEVSTKYQYITVLGWVTTLWHDPRLEWDPAEYEGLDYITIPSPDVWVPTFVLANSASNELYNEFWYTLFKVQVYHDGRMKWTPGGIFKADCPIDIDFFPFDEQICEFRFENWVYMGDKVNLTYTINAQSNILQYYTVENGQWDIKDVAVFRHDKYFFETTPYPRVHFGMHMRRKSLYYVTNIILLSMMLAVLVLFIFKLPAESGERVSMGVTLLLAFSVFILMINDNIPETSSAVPIIIVYLICFMALTSLGICESVFILYCYHHSGKHAPPYYIRYIFYKMLPGMSNRKITLPEDNMDVDNKERKHSAADGTDDEAVGALNKTNKNKVFSEEECIQEWQDLSRQIDIFCFWLFLAVFLLLVIILLVFIPISFRAKNIEMAVKQWEND